MLPPPNSHTPSFPHPHTPSLPSPTLSLSLDHLLTHTLPPSHSLSSLTNEARLYACVRVTLHRALQDTAILTAHHQQRPVLVGEGQRCTCDGGRRSYATSGCPLLLPLCTSPSLPISHLHISLPHLPPSLPPISTSPRALPTLRLRGTLSVNSL